MKQKNKTLRIMRISFFLIFISIFNLSAGSGYFQNKDISLKSSSTHTIRNVISDEIEESSKLNAQITSSVVQQSSDKKITGRVADIYEEPLPGVTVIIKGTTEGTTTDIDGSFSLTNVSADAILQISFVGMKTQEIPIGNQTRLDVVMEEEATRLEEFVAVGYGIQKKVNVIGSVSSVDSEKLTVAPIANVTNTLAGRLPGLISKQESGVPGSDDASLSIRGFGSPLIIVDGFEADFNKIDANQIESITILKDASAAIYGSRAGNGVVLVTTKRGSVGKPIIQFQASLSTQSATNLPKRASSGQIAEMDREAHFNTGKSESTAPWSQEEIDLFYKGTDPDYPNTDLWDLITRDLGAPQQQYNLSVRGGSDKIKYYGFLGLLDQKTMFKNGGGYKRYNLQSNIDAQITSNLNLKLDVAAVSEDSETPNRSINRDVWQDYWVPWMFYQPTLPDGRLAYTGGGPTVGLHASTNLDHYPSITYDKKDLKGTVSLTYDFDQVIEGLSATVFGNYNQKYTFQKGFSHFLDSWIYNYSNDTYTKMTSASAPALFHSDTKNRVLTGQFLLNFDRTFAQKHQVSALMIYELIDYKNDWISAGRRNYSTTAIPYLFAGAVDSQFADGRASEMGRQSYIGRFNYSYASKYLLEAVFRFDESAKFSKDKRRGFFPGFLLGWRLSEENFVKDNVPVLDNLKLKISTGQTGNDAVGNFQYLSGYQYADKYITGSSASLGLRATGLPNPYLSWEKMKTHNAGLEFGLMKGKLYGELDFFYRLRDGIPGTQVKSVPSTFGATLPTVNLNSISTRGFELMLGSEGKLNDLRWNIAGNLSWSRSKWDRYDEPKYEDEDSERLNKLTGRWTDVRFGYKSDGLFTSQEEIDALPYVYDKDIGNEGVKPGAIKFLDTNGDGVIDWRDQVEIGKGTTPNWMSGLNIDLNYKNFDFSALFQGAFGFYNSVSVRGGSVVQYEERWTEENNRKDALVPRLGILYTDAPEYGTFQTSGASDFYLQKADYLRLKTISFGYTIPSSLIKKINIEKLRIYIAGTNVFTLSRLNKYGIDPEAPDGLGGFYYPQMRTFSLGLRLSL